MDSTDKSKNAFITSALIESKEASLKTVIDVFGFDPAMHLLDQIVIVKQELDVWGLALYPDVSEGDLDTIRLIKLKIPKNITRERAKEEILSDESSDLEFKGSLLFDIKKFVNEPCLPINQYRSESVLFSVLKTISAFLNCGGGVLYLGVNNDGTIFGLHQDCKILKQNTFNADIFQLELRNQVTGKFKDGISINDYIEIRYFTDSELSFARLLIRGRQKASFIIQDSNCRLYRRQGNRSVEVKIEEAEEFFKYRKDQSWT